MSVRMLQRALRSQEKQKQPISSQSDPDEGSDDETTLRAVGNSFDLLGAQDEPEEVEEEVSGNNPLENEKPSALPKDSGKKAKKKKTKKGKKVSGPEIPVEDDVDQLLKSFSVSQKEEESTRASTSNGINVNYGNILTVDTRQLRAEDELKRIFGSKVINAVEREGTNNSYGGLRRRQGLRPKTGRGNFMKRTTLVTPREMWPFWDDSISMELTHIKDGLQYFKYNYTPSYMETHNKYQMSGAFHDPNSIAMLLAQQPFHLDSLLALAELCKQLGDYQQSVEWLERCIFALECAWHPSFNPFNGSCKLPFEQDTNKSFFYALSKHMLHLGRRGCHRTALEVCKLLLNLDTDDPLGALFSIDYFALRAEQYEWLERLADCYNTDSSLRLFPNFSFSLAVARFYLEQRQAVTDLGKENEVTTSGDLFKQALLLHPATLQKLVEKAPIKEDAEWGRILRHPHFKRATSGGPSLEHLINLYAERNHLIWRLPELQAQLKKAALSVIEAADKDPGEVANWACVRQETFSSEHNEYKHLHFSEFSDTAPPMPPEELQNMMLHGGGEGNNVDRQVALAGLEGRNGLRVFLESLFPWNVVGADLHGQDIQDLVAGRELDAEEED
ncbi:hypothetical protein L7F22_066160 [Adiantum nelumboides]|nr:hypothetical protein [Adiantum nelumboides]